MINFKKEISKNIASSINLEYEEIEKNKEIPKDGANGY